MAVWQRGGGGIVKEKVIVRDKEQKKLIKEIVQVCNRIKKILGERNDKRTYRGKIARLPGMAETTKRIK